MEADAPKELLWPLGSASVTHGSRGAPCRRRRGCAGTERRPRELSFHAPVAPEGPGSASRAPNLPPRSADTFTSLVSDDRTELREGYAEVGDVRLHCVEAGDGPLIVLLHGFPEFWFSWRLQIAPLAAAGFRVVAPDLRGYNLSSRPADVEAYSADRLAADVRGLIRQLGAKSALLVGHD